MPTSVDTASRTRADHVNTQTRTAPSAHQSVGEEAPHPQGETAKR
jgi:hypothetical protein